MSTASTKAERHEHVGSREIDLLARIERLPASRPMLWARTVVGMATFFDGYTTLAIAYSLPVLAKVWHLSPTTTAAIISSGYLGQLFGAVIFSWLAERIGRLPVLIATTAIFALMSGLCICAWSANSLMLFRFIQGVGTGGEVPVASAYVNEFSSARRRGRFFLLYELLFLIGLVFSGLIGYELVPNLGWKAMFVVGFVPVTIVAVLQLFLPESPRWLINKCRYDDAEKVIAHLEKSLTSHGVVLPEPQPLATPVKAPCASASWREMFSPFYRPRTLLLWSLWFGSYMINNGLVTWLPTLYRTVYNVPVDKAIANSFLMTGVALFVSLICALSIDRVGRRRWYTGALILGSIPMICLWANGASTAQSVFLFATLTYSAIQTVTYSLYLYSSELYPTRLRSVGAGLGSAWLRAGSMVGPWMIGLIAAHGSIHVVFIVFAAVGLLTGVICFLWAPETTGRVLEEVSP